jgi:N-acetylated-alpha-linked acidic dipeptidase
VGPPPHLDTPPAIDLAPLTAAADAITRAAQRYAQIAAGAQNIPAAKLDSVNRLLMQSERKLLDEQGLPGRPWFKHVIYAPGIYTGYAAKTIPGVREALEERRWAEATQQVKSVSSVLQGEAALIEATAAELEKVSVGK